ncbi:MAG: hypothetical protein PVF79_21620 [Desulfobacterales bacterium]
MRRRIGLFFIIPILICVCTPIHDKRPKIDFSSGTRIGLINLLESFATHTHFSSISTQRFTKTYAVDWEMPDYVDKELMKLLQHDQRFTLVRIPQTESSDLNQHAKDFSDLANSDTITPVLADRLEHLAKASNVDIIIFIYSYNGPSIFTYNAPSQQFNQAKAPIWLGGYGLFTRWLNPAKLLRWLPFRGAYPYAHIAVSVFSSQPLTWIATGKPKLTSTTLGDFDWPSDVKKLPLAELKKARPGIDKYAYQALQNALQMSNLLPSKQSPTLVPPGTKPPR